MMISVGTQLTYLVVRIGFHLICWEMIILQLMKETGMILTYLETQMMSLPGWVLTSLVKRQALETGMILTFSEMGKARRQRLFVLMLIMIRGIGMILRHSVFVMMESNTGMKLSFFPFLVFLGMKKMISHHFSVLT